MASVKRVVALIAVVYVRNVVHAYLYGLHRVGIQIEDDNSALASVCAKNVGITTLRSKTGMGTLPWIGRWTRVK